MPFKSPGTSLWMFSFSLVLVGLCQEKTMIFFFCQYCHFHLVSTHVILSSYNAYSSLLDELQVQQLRCLQKLSTAIPYSDG